MGNGSSRPTMKIRKDKPRAVLETPQASSTDTAQPRVTFANKRSGNDYIKVRPRMTDIGTVHTDITNGGRLRFQRSQTNRQGSTSGLNESTSVMNASFTSIRSAASGPVDGVWEPTLDPYERTNNADYSYRLTRNGDLNVNENNFNRYIGFTERDYSYGTRVDNGLARVDEI